MMMNLMMMFFPIPSMYICMVYLPTNVVDVYGKLVGKYTKNPWMVFDVDVDDDVDVGSPSIAVSDRVTGLEKRCVLLGGSWRVWIRELLVPTSMSPWRISKGGWMMMMGYFTQGISPFTYGFDFYL